MENDWLDGLRLGSRDIEAIALDVRVAVMSRTRWSGPISDISVERGVCHGLSGCYESLQAVAPDHHWSPHKDRKPRTVPPPSQRGFFCCHLIGPDHSCSPVVARAAEVRAGPLVWRTGF